jgi:lipopolysaccharide transport system permease protein
MPLKTVTYEPDNSLRHGYLSLFPDIFREMARNRWLTYQLFKRDFLTVYKQSFLGFLWVVIIPLVSVATFLLLRRSGVFAIGTLSVPYPLYALLGMAFWQLFATGLIASSNSLVTAGALIVKINFSKKSLVLASAGQSLVSFGIQMTLTSTLFVVYGVTPSWTILLLPLLILPVLLLTLGLGFLLALLNGVFRDIGNTISVLLTFMLFLTPVLYPRPESGLLATLADYNPLYPLVAGPRDMILTGTLSSPGSFALASVGSVVVFLAALLLFHLTETRLTERI